MAGRKSLRDEIGILRRYNDLSVPYFKFITKMITSDKKADQMWAAERLDKAFVKMVPQVIAGEGDKGEFVFKVLTYSPNDSDNPTPQVHS
jgi:hypothetical protein